MVSDPCVEVTRISYPLAPSTSDHVTVTSVPLRTTAVTVSGAARSTAAVVGVGVAFGCSIDYMDGRS